MNNTGKITKATTIILTIALIAFLAYVIAGPLYGAYIKQGPGVQTGNLPVAEGGGDGTFNPPQNCAEACAPYDNHECTTAACSGTMKTAHNCQSEGYHCCCWNDPSGCDTCGNDQDCIDCGTGNTCIARWGSCLTVEPNCDIACPNHGFDEAIPMPGVTDTCWISGGKPNPYAPTCEDLGGTHLSGEYCDTDLLGGSGVCCCRDDPEPPGYYFPEYTHVSKNSKSEAICGSATNNCEYIDNLLPRRPGAQEIRIYRNVDPVDCDAGYTISSICGTGPDCRTDCQGFDCDCTPINNAVAVWRNGGAYDPDSLDFPGTNDGCIRGSGIDTYTIYGNSEYTLRSGKTTEGCEIPPFYTVYKILCRNDDDCRTGDTCQPDGLCQAGTQEYYAEFAEVSQRMTGAGSCSSSSGRCQVLSVSDALDMGQTVAVEGGDFAGAATIDSCEAGDDPDYLSTPAGCQPRTASWTLPGGDHTITGATATGAWGEQDAFAITYSVNNCTLTEYCMGEDDICDTDTGYCRDPDM